MGNDPVFHPVQRLMRDASGANTLWNTHLDEPTLSISDGKSVVLMIAAADASLKHYFKPASCHAHSFFSHTMRPLQKLYNFLRTQDSRSSRLSSSSWAQSCRKQKPLVIQLSPCSLLSPCSFSAFVLSTMSAGSETRRWETMAIGREKDWFQRWKDIPAQSNGLLRTRASSRKTLQDKPNRRNIKGQY